jgi:hypothetical protein
MSALLPKADIDARGCDVCFVPIADIVRMTSAPRVVVFRQGLTEMGRGQNLTIRCRGAEDHYRRLPELALFG